MIEHILEYSKYVKKCLKNMLKNMLKNVKKHEKNGKYYILKILLHNKRLEYFSHF